jgi:hypothetical protein
MSRWRKFLQLASQDVDSYVAVTIPRNAQDMSMVLKIADCNKSIELYFNLSTLRNQKISRKKIAILKEAINKLEEGLEKLSG